MAANVGRTRPEEVTEGGETLDGQEARVVAGPPIADE